MTCPRPATRPLRLVLAWVFLQCGVSWLSGAEAPRTLFSISGGDAALTLRQLSRQARESVVFPIDLVHGIQTQPVQGELTARDAAERMVAGTELFVSQDPQTGALLIARRAPPESAAAQSPPSNQSFPSLMKPRTTVGALRAWLGLALAPASFAAIPNAGSLSGNVSNAATGNLLAGARIEVPALGVETYTDGTGHYTFDKLPAGTHEVVASYLGLDPLRTSATVVSGQSAVCNLDLTSSIYRLDAFKVTGEREGNALALTAQRNAPNVKNLVAIDAYGNLPNMNASELAVLLPGVGATPNDEGNYNQMTVRGIANPLNTVTIDGAMFGNQSGAGRGAPIHTITGSMFESLEVIKGQTPDKGADSLGGTVNLKSRSPLSMKEKRRVTYNLSDRWAPPFTQQIPLREQHRAHPLLNAAYQEVFDIFGGDRNLGISVNLFYSEQAVGYFSTTRNYQTTSTAPAYLWDYGMMDNYNNRRQSSINAKFEYRLSPSTKLSLNTIYNDAIERFRLRYSLRLYTGNAATVPSATSGIVPGFTARITEVRAVSGSNVDNTSQMAHFAQRQRHVSAEVEHKWGPLGIDYAFIISPDHINNGGGDGGALITRSIAPVGWIIDRTQSDLYPRIVQTAGPDLNNPASYKPNSYTFNDAQFLHLPKELRANLRYKLPTAFELSLKTGVLWREQKVEDRSKNRSFSFTGVNSAQLPTDPTVVTWGNYKSGLHFPQWNPNAIAHNRTPLDPSLWTLNSYANEVVKFTGNRGATETVDAGYVMTEGRIGRTGFLAGVRTEKTEDDSWGWVKTRIGASTAAEQVANPVAAAQKDYASTRRELHGSYTRSFPSVHLTEDITPNLKARVSWSTGFGRPPISNMYPSETANDTARTLTIPNLSLRPQTSDNWDTSLEYYFEPVGNLSVGWFRKKVTDYFVSGIERGTVGTGADNGYNGDYAGYTILGQANLGTAFISGWEVNYLQQFTFLPGVLKGLALSANFTALDTHGNFGSTVEQKTGQVPGFIPHSANVSVSWRHHKFSSRVTINRTGEYMRNFAAVGSGANQWTRARKITNVGLAYQLRPAVSLTMDVQNVFNQMQSWYRGNPDNLSQAYIPGTTITFGVSGRF